MWQDENSCLREGECRTQKPEPIGRSGRLLSLLYLKHLIRIPYLFIHGMWVPSSLTEVLGLHIPREASGRISSFGLCLYRNTKEMLI